MSSRTVATRAASALRPYLLARAGSQSTAPTLPQQAGAASSSSPLPSSADSYRAEDVLSVLGTHFRNREVELAMVNGAMHSPDDDTRWRRFERLLTEEVGSNAALAERLRALLLPTEPRLDEFDSFFGTGIAHGSDVGTGSDLGTGSDPGTGSTATVELDDAAAAGAAGSDRGWSRLLADVEDTGTLLTFYEPPEKSRRPVEPPESSDDG